MVDRSPSPQAEAAGSPHRHGLLRRRRLLMAVLAGSVVVTAAGMGSAALLKSPAQAAAETRPPAPDVITAPVERKVLSETVVARGQVAASQHVSVSGAGVGGSAVGRSVVTKVRVQPGRPLHMGQVLLEISGRPVFVLKGALPAYRDLRTGSRGEDVTQLQKALAAVGHSTGGDRAGVFGSGTEKAVVAFYRAIGFEPATAGADKSDSGSGAAAADPAGSGSVVPMSEVVFVRSASAQVDDVAAEVGEEAGPDLVSVSAGGLVVNGSVAAYQKGLLRPGQKVDIASESTGQQLTGTVQSVAQRPTGKEKGSEPQSAEGYAVRIRPTGKLPASLVGEDVRLTIAAASSSGSVLAVPVSAVSAGADGRTTVTVRKAGGDRRVAVRTGMTADGYAEIIPTVRGGLAPGDQVIVGVDTRGDTADRP
ncbi:peptidoglycan-binding protein [Streptomyces sp. 900116325]